jgi:hypothetical protein
MNQNNLGLNCNTVWDAQLEHKETQEKIKFLRGEDENLELNSVNKEKILSKLMLLNNKLFKQPTEEFKNPRPYVPPGPLRHLILNALHNDPLAGHGGVQKTLQRIKSRFYWEKMTHDIAHHVKRCPCHLNKVANTKRYAPLNPIKIGKPFENWVVDHIVMPRSKHGYEYILTMVDRFTKMVELAPTKTKSMAEAAKKFQNHVLYRWGIPKTVLADNAFRGEFEKLCDANGIKVDHNLPYQHMTMGLVERMNRTVNETLRNYVNADHTDWDEFLKATQFAINSAMSSAHNFTPFKVGTTRDPAFPIERILLKESEKVTTVPDAEPPTSVQKSQPSAEAKAKETTPAVSAKSKTPEAKEPDSDSETEEPEKEDSEVT